MKTKTQPTEQVFPWEDLDETYRFTAIVTYAKALRTKKIDTIRRVFDLVNPKIIFGHNGDQAYCTVAPESIADVKLLLRDYLY